MEEKIKEAMPNVLKKQIDAVIDEVVTLEIQIVFVENDLDEKLKKAKKEKNKEQREAMIENLEKLKLQQLHPMKDNRIYKKKYYDYLCTL